MKNTFFMFLALLCCCPAFAQEIEVKGTVTSASDGLEVIGANVLVQGTTVGTITDINGQFSVTMPDGNNVLIISCVGFKTETITVSKGMQELTVVLKEDTELLGEVVVVGYGTTKKALVTGANLNVKGEDIAALNTGSAMEALQGIAPGLSITKDNGSPGAGTKVTIRGLGTAGSASPLYIVDGVSMDGIDFLNPSDIATIDVLKDAASAAIYGSRAANGVILVTTKKGKANEKARITYDGYYGVQNIYRKPSLLNAQEYMFITDEGRANDGLAPRDWENLLMANGYLNNTYPGQLGTKYGQDIWENLQNGWTGTDWVDEIAKKDAPMQSHSLSIVGGGKDVIYSLGTSFYDQSSIIGGDIANAGYRRFTARMNTEMVLLRKGEDDLLKIGQTLTYTNSKRRIVATGNIYWNDMSNAIKALPLMPAYWQDSPDDQKFAPLLDGITTQELVGNPLPKLYYDRDRFKNGSDNNIVGSVYAVLEPIKDLKIRTAFGVNASFGNSRQWGATHKGLGAMYVAVDHDKVSQEMKQYYAYTWTNTVNYKKTFGEHTIEALVGNEINKKQMDLSMNGFKKNSLFGDFKHAYLNNVNKPTNIADIDVNGVDWGAQGNDALLSYMSRLSYNYKDRYMVDATFRADGSSNFAKGNQWGYFPSVSAGWNFSEEAFMEKFSFLDYGKLRFSWGQNGNKTLMDQYGNYVGFIYSSNISYINPGYYLGGNKLVTGSAGIPANVPNKDISWETSEQLNIGFDTKFLNSRLSLTFDWYKKTTKDWLVVAPIMGTAGAGAPFINGGSIQNKGFELSLGWNDQVADFDYGARLSVSHNSNKVTSLASSDGVLMGPSNVLSQGSSYISRIEVGQPIGFFYGYKADGILQNQDEVDAYVGPTGKPYFEDQRPGDIRFVDQNSDGVIDEQDKVKLGNPHPKFEMGLQLNASYKGFYVNATLTGKFGMQVMNGYFWNDNVNQNFTTQIFNRWHGEGTSNKIPRLSFSSHRNTLWISDAFMYDADFVRINNLTVGYDFTKLVKDIDWVQGGKVYMSVSNLHTFTGYEGLDPDVAFGGDNCSWSSGIDLGLYPLPRTFMVGVNVTF